MSVWSSATTSSNLAMSSNSQNRSSERTAVGDANGAVKRQRDRDGGSTAGHTVHHARAVKTRDAFLDPEQSQAAVGLAAALPPRIEANTIVGDHHLDTVADLTDGDAARCGLS